MEHSPVIPGSPYFIMTYDTAKKLTGITEQTGVLALEVSDDNFETVLSAVSEIAERNGKIEVNTIEQTIASIQKYYSPTIKTFYMISAILFVFGGISLMNMLMVDLQNRKREFGLLRAVGTTQNQLRKMLNRELMIYLAGSLLIALVVSSIASFITCKRLGCGKSLYQFLLPLVVPSGLCYSAYGYLLRVFFIHVRRTKEYRYYGGHTRIVEKNIGWKIRMIEMRLKRDSKITKI